VPTTLIQLDEKTSHDDGKEKENLPHAYLSVSHPGSASCRSTSGFNAIQRANQQHKDDDDGTQSCLPNKK
jgi:hypothetical protein